MACGEQNIAAGECEHYRENYRETELRPCVGHSELWRQIEKQPDGRKPKESVQEESSAGQSLTKAWARRYRPEFKASTVQAWR